MPLQMVIRTQNKSYPQVNGNDRSVDLRSEWSNLRILPPSIQNQRYFDVQVCCNSINHGGNSDNVDDSNSENDCDKGFHQRFFHGCCGAEFPRLILLREMNFVVYSEFWDLYVLSYQAYNWDDSCSSIYRCLHMALIPYSHHATIEECRNWKLWTHIGKLRACVLRMDFEASVLQYLSHHDKADMNQAMTSASFHWHVDVFMDSIIDESYKCVSISTATPFVEQFPQSISHNTESLSGSKSQVNSATTNILQESGIHTIEIKEESWGVVAAQGGNLYHEGCIKPRKRTRRRRRYDVLKKIADTN